MFERPRASGGEGQAVFRERIENQVGCVARREPGKNAGCDAPQNFLHQEPSTTALCANGHSLLQRLISLLATKDLPFSNCGAGDTQRGNQRSPGMREAAMIPPKGRRLKFVRNLRAYPTPNRTTESFEGEMRQRLGLGANRCKGGTSRNTGRNVFFSTRHRRSGIEVRAWMTSR